MSTPTIATDAGSNAPDAARAAYPFPRVMAWCLRRELWENRSIYIAPFATAGVLIIAVIIPLVTQLLTRNGRFTGNVSIHGDVANGALWIAYAIIAMPVLAIGMLVAIAYCLSALHGERRDRSILFWKSLPVSDSTTVLSKAAVPLFLVPLVSFAAAVITQLALFAIALLVFPLLAARAHLVWNGMPIDYHTAGLIWIGVPVGYLTFAMLYGLLTTALWHAPIYAWLLLVGGWAKRMTFLWAVAPVGAVMLVERIAFGTDSLEILIKHRLVDSVSLAFSDMQGNALPYLTPGRFVSDPGLWGGLAVAAFLLGAAVLLRRYRQPI
jgi:ABC-2 type transport system permease protein